MLFGALFFALAAETGCTKETLDHYKNEGFVDIELAWPEGAAPKGTRVLFYPVAADGKAVAAAEGSRFLPIRVSSVRPTDSTAECLWVPIRCLFITAIRKI